MTKRYSELSDAQLREEMRIASRTPGKTSRKQYERLLDEAIRREGNS